jgi:predicted dehydrogenase
MSGAAVSLSSHLPSAPVRFAVIGTGGRAQFFHRLARAAPERLEMVGVVTRTQERASAVRAEWDVPAYQSLAAICARHVPTSSRCA